MNVRRLWHPGEIAQLREQYPHMRTEIVARMLDRSLTTTYQTAKRFGIAKSPEFFASPASGRTTGRQGIGSRFAKGHTTWNKGKHWVAGGRSKETRFKKGARPWTWRPVGSERVNADGYRDRKVTDTGYPPRDWVGIHRLNWIAAHGPIPKGAAVTFKDGNPLNCELPNLELLTRADLMRRNTVHNLPKPLAEIVQLRGALMRQINKREGKHGKQDRGSEGAPVRGARRAARRNQAA